MFQFKLPDIGEGVVEAELTRWCVKEGDVVAENQVLAELLTDKAAIEIPSPRAGKVAKLNCKEGEIIKVGAVLIEIDEGNGAPASAPAAGKTAPERKPGASPVEESKAGVEPPAVPPRPRAHALPSDAMTPHTGVAAGLAVPAVREYARSVQVDLAGLVGSGPGGRIMRRDIDAALTTRGTDAAGARHSGRRALMSPPSEQRQPSQDPADWKRVPLRGLRRTIAERMVQSKFTAPHYTYIEEIDMTAVEALRRQLNSRGGEEYSPLVFIARAVVRALAGFPLLNATLDDTRGEIVLKGKIHLGIATAVDDGLLVPVVPDAGAMSTPALATAIRTLTQKARDGKLTPGELKSGTFTISSLGKLGGVAATPILNPPEVAIVGVNAIRRLPRYVNGDTGKLEPRQIMNLSMSLDHRVVDGAVCAQFVTAVRTILEAADFDDLPGVKP